MTIKPIATSLVLVCQLSLLCPPPLLWYPYMYPSGTDLEKQEKSPAMLSNQSDSFTFKISGHVTAVGSTGTFICLLNRSHCGGYLLVTDNHFIRKSFIFFFSNYFIFFGDYHMTYLLTLADQRYLLWHVLSPPFHSLVHNTVIYFMLLHSFCFSHL